MEVRTSSSEPYLFSDFTSICFPSKYDSTSGWFFKLGEKYSSVYDLILCNVNYDELHVCGYLNLLDPQTRGF